MFSKRERAQWYSASPYRHDAAAGLARVAMAHGDTAAAMQALAPLLAIGTLAEVTTDDPLEGAEFPRLIEWTCHRIVASAAGRHDSGAAAWLARAHRALQRQAAAISDPALRQAFLANIPVHREIVAASTKGA